MFSWPFWGVFELIIMVDCYDLLCVPASVRAFTLSNINISETRGLITIFFSKASRGWGKGCIRFRCRSDQNTGFHGNR